MATGEAPLSGEGKAVASRELVHELRNLLAVVVNYCELIADETGDPEAIRTDLKEIRTAAERALDLTDRIPVSPKSPPEPEPMADS
jgi:signal transduction histidine kinase